MIFPFMLEREVLGPFGCTLPVALDDVLNDHLGKTGCLDGLLLHFVQLDAEFGDG